MALSGTPTSVNSFTSAPSVKGARKCLLKRDGQPSNIPPLGQDLSRCWIVKTEFGVSRYVTSVRSRR